MSAPLPSLTDEARRSIQTERTRQVYALAFYGQPLGVAAAAVLALGLWLGGGPDWLGGWFAAMAAVLAGEVRFAYRYLRSSPEDRQGPGWEQALALACALSGLLWAVLALGCIGSVPPTLEIVLAIALVGITTATIGALAISASAFYGYTLPPLLGLIAAYTLRGGVENLTLAVLVGLHLAFLVAAQRTLSAQFVERVLARSRNDDLLGQLTQADTALKKSLAEHQLLLDLATVGIAEIRGRRIVRTNAQLETMLGYDADAMVDAPVSIFYPAASHERFGELGDPLARGLTVERDVQVQRRDGSLLWVALTSRALEPSLPGSSVIAVLNDITDRRERESAMHRLAHEDALTGLPNRRLLEDRLRQALLRARRSGGCVALLLLDLDGFKRINDQHGHAAGDQVLATVARRLLGCVRASDTVSRIGGDEFVVLLDDPVHADDAGAIAQKLVAAASEPVRIGELSLQVGASVGISIAPDDSLEAEALLRYADAAMYGAKEAGRGAWRRYADGTPVL